MVGTWGTVGQQLRLCVPVQGAEIHSLLKEIPHAAQPIKKESGKKKNGGQFLWKELPPLSRLLPRRFSLVQGGLMSTPFSDIRKSVGLVGTCFVFEITHRLPFCFGHQGEKRKMSDSHVLEETKKPRVLGDIPPELIREAMSAITDPAATLAPEVSRGRASRPGWAPWLRSRSRCRGWGGVAGCSGLRGGQADERFILLMTAMSWGNIISTIEGIPPASTFYLEKFKPS